MRAVFALTLVALVAPAPARELVDDRIASDTTVFISAPVGGPTATPTPTPTPTPAAGSSDWSAAIDHCWNFDGDANDDCTGATAVDLAAISTGPTWDTTTKVDGANSASFTTSQGFQTSGTTILASPGSDALTMWCFVNLSSIAANGSIMGKWSSPSGYELSLLVNTGAEDLSAQENGQSPSIANIWSATPTGWSFVWWRAKGTAAAATMRLGQWAGASTLNVTTAATTATLADAAAVRFQIFAGNKGTLAGNVDECGWEANNLDDASLCKICSCGEDGAACSCSGAAYTSEGRNDTHCGGCTLPACNAASPTNL